MSISPVSLSSNVCFHVKDHNTVKHYSPGVSVRHTNLGNMTLSITPSCIVYIKTVDSPYNDLLNS